MVTKEKNLLVWFVYGSIFLLIQKYLLPIYHIDTEQIFALSLVVKLILSLVIGGWFSILKNKLNKSVCIILAVVVSCILIMGKYNFPLYINRFFGWGTLLYSLAMFCFISGLLTLDNAHNKVYRLVVLASVLILIPPATIFFYGLIMDLAPFKHNFGKADGFLIMFVGFLTMLITFIVGIFWVFKQK